MGGRELGTMGEYLMFHLNEQVSLWPGRTFPLTSTWKGFLRVAQCLRGTEAGKHLFFILIDSPREKEGSQPVPAASEADTPVTAMLMGATTACLFCEPHHQHALFMRFLLPNIHRQSPLLIVAQGL